MGKSEVEIGRARIAFKHTPTDAELNPIFPTIPGCLSDRMISTYMPIRDKRAYIPL